MWQISVVGDEITVVYGEVGGKMQSVSDRGVVKNRGRANEVSAEDDALAEAGRMVLAQLRQGYVEEGASAPTFISWESLLPGNLRFYKPDNSLTTALESRLDARAAWLSRKRDGEMIVVVKGADSRVDIYSRRMLLSHHLEIGQFQWRDRMPALVAELEGRSDIPPRSIILGDLVADSKEDGRWAVASFVKSRTEAALEMPPPLFYAWDIAWWGGIDVASVTPIGARYHLIWEAFGREWPGNSWVVPVEAWEVQEVLRMSGQNSTAKGEELLAALRSAAKAWDYEGWVVVDPDGVYGDRAYNFRGKTDRPGKFCGKLKPVEEDDFIGFFDPDGVENGMGPLGKWGTGNNRGTVGSVALFQVNSAGEMVYVCDCGSGIDDAFRAAYSDPAVYPLVLQVEYSDRTYKSEGDKTNALTHPRLVAVRDDKAPAECVNARLD